MAEVTSLHWTLKEGPKSCIFMALLKEWSCISIKAASFAAVCLPDIGVICGLDPAGAPDICQWHYGEQCLRPVNCPEWDNDVSSSLLCKGNQLCFDDDQPDISPGMDILEILNVLSEFPFLSLVAV